MILDEATSAVDSESENLIHEAMERLMDGRTIFLITHRLRSAVDADLVVVLDQGRIVETGTHWELLNRRGLYARLFTEQVRGLTADPAFSPARGAKSLTIASHLDQLRTSLDFAGVLGKMRSSPCNPDARHSYLS